MGAEESKSQTRNRSTTTSPQNVSRDEVKQLLDQQKREYERKLRELQIRTSNSAQNNRTVETARDVTSRNADQILGEQLQEFAQIAYNAATANSGTQRIATQPNVRSPNSVNLSTTQNSSEELRNIQSAQPQKQQLYPQLDSISNQRTISSNMPRRTVPTPVVQPSPGQDFVFVNKNQNSYRAPFARPGPSFKPGPASGHINQNIISLSFEPKPSTSRVQPSAPTQSALQHPPSTSSPTSKPQANRNKRDNFSCITCGNKFGLTIYQCSSGHSSCRDCKMRSESCGICKKNISDIRNIALEALVAELKQQCPNHAEGCNYYCKNADLEKHLKECPFREFDCPMHTLFGQCNWRGKLSQVATHFGDNHPENIKGNVDTEMHLINVVDTNHNVYFIEMSPYNFLVHLKVDETERRIFMAVQLLGTQVSALKWTYEIQVYNKREPRRKFQHSDVCQSSSVPVQEIFNDMKCATLSLAYALTFINEGCLTYKFYIKKENDESTSKGKLRGRGRGRGRGAKDHHLEPTAVNIVDNQTADSDQASIEPMNGTDAKGVGPMSNTIRNISSSPIQLTTEFKHMLLKIYLLVALHYSGIRAPTEFQEIVLPLLLEEPPRNVIVTSALGIGKSTAFVLALLNKVDINLNYPQVLYVCCSDDTVTEIKEIIVRLARFCSQKITHVVMREQPCKITETIIVGTSEKIIYGLKYKPFDMNKINVFIADDLHSGYCDGVEFLTNLLQSTCQMIYLAQSEQTMEYFGTKTPNCEKMQLS